MAPRGILVLDLDGTVLIGDDPVRSYADSAARILDERRPGSGAELRSAVDAYLAGEPTIDALDGYTATATAARDRGLSDDDLTVAYASVAGNLDRFHLGSPPELDALLSELRPAIRTIVASNAPLAWVGPVLDRLALAPLVDEQHGSLGKPDGLRLLVRRLIADHGMPPACVLGVGDIWRNDLEPLAEIGAATALIDRWGRAGGAPDHRAATFGELVPAIRAWAAEVTAS